MTLEEWQTIKKAQWEAPANAAPYPFEKNATRDAWYNAYEQGCTDMIRHIAAKQQEAREKNREQSDTTE